MSQFNANTLPPLRETIDTHGLRAKKSLGQNFLLDLNITRKIVRSGGNLNGQHVIEVGPGPGGLTRALLESDAKSVTVIEKDTRCLAALQELKSLAGDRLNIISGDAMTVNLSQIVPEGPRHIIANLPYNIATPLLVGWLKLIREKTDYIAGLTLMFQKEVAQRITAVPDTKAYGRLAILSQWLCDAHICFDLPPEAFTPPPKVHSSVVQFTPKHLDKPQPDFKKIEALTAKAFSQRRKTLRKTLGELAEKHGIDKLRPENIPVKDYIRLAKEP